MHQGGTASCHLLRWVLGRDSLRRGLSSTGHSGLKTEPRLECDSDQHGLEVGLEGNVGGTRSTDHHDRNDHSHAVVHLRRMEGSDGHSATTTSTDARVYSEKTGTDGTINHLEVEK